MSRERDIPADSFSITADGAPEPVTLVTGKDDRNRPHLVATCDGREWEFGLNGRTAHLREVRDAATDERLPETIPSWLEEALDEGDVTVSE